MATKTKSTKPAKGVYYKIKNTTKDLHDELLETSKNLVEGSLESGEQWQQIIEKGFKGGTKLLNNQQNYMLNTVEAVKKQYDVDAERFGKLFGLDKLAERGNSMVKTIKNFAPKLTSRVEDTMEKATKTTTATAKKMTKAANKLMDVVEDTAEEAVKVTKKLVNIEDKVVAKPVKKGLTVIDGIGPKMEIILNNAGIKTITQLKKASAADLRKILDAAGPRYKMFNPQLWIDQAKKA